MTEKLLTTDVLVVTGCVKDCVPRLLLLCSNSELFVHGFYRISYQILCGQILPDGKFLMTLLY